MTKFTISIMLLLLCCIGAPYTGLAKGWQQAAIIVKGRITSDKKEPLPGVNVSLKGTSAGTRTDADGRFTLTVPGPHSVLVFSFVGLATQEQVVGNNTVFNIVLKDQISSLNDVVVVGYGKQKQATVTGSVSTIGEKELVQTSVSSISNMLVGRSPGISALQGSGEPGRNSAAIHIRGISTLNGNAANPLIVIDGVQQAAEQPYTMLNNMDANDIDNISILKDASSTAVYGIRGANGVIIVTTKRGKAGRLHLGLTANHGITQTTSVLQTVTSYEYAIMRNEAIRSDVGNHANDNVLFTDEEIWKFKNDRDYTPAEVDAMTTLTAAQKTQLKNTPAMYFSSHDWLREQFGAAGPQQQYNVNISGGTAKIKYFSSLGYFSQDGILKNTSYGGGNTNSNYNRYNFRSNFDIDVAKNFQVSINLGGQFVSTAGPASDYGGSYENVKRYKALSQFIYEGNPFEGPGIINNHLVTGYVGASGSVTNPIGLKGGDGSSPITTLLVSQSEVLNNTNLSGTVTLKHSMDYLTQGLNAHATVSYDDSYTKGIRRRNNIPTYTAKRNTANPNEILFNGGTLYPAELYDNQDLSIWRKVYLEGAIDYNHSFGDHTITGLLLGNAQRYTMPSDSYNTPSGLMGLVGRVTYNYKERYLAEFDMGYNGTEQFEEGKRFGYFPAYSAGWVISNESFFHQNKWVSLVKLRGSYGEVGNDQLNGSRYLYLPSTWKYYGPGVWQNQGYWFGNSNGSGANPYYPGVTEGLLGNPNVTWERTRKSNIALEMRFFNDRLSFTADVFQEKRNNILVQVSTVPVTFGVPTSQVPPSNVGRVSNKGYELQLGWKDRIGKVDYFVRSNLSFAKNKVDYKAEVLFPDKWMNETGYSIGQYKGLKSDGFYNTQAELNNRPFNTFDNNLRLGDIRYKDINGDGKIDQTDMVPIGYSNLPQFAYNLTIGFSYKGFDLSALLIGTAKGSFPMNGYLTIPFFKGGGNALQYEYDGRWTAEKAANHEAILYPRATFNNSASNNNYLRSDFWLKSNDFKRLKNVEIGYTMKDFGFMRKGGISSIRVYSNANNLFTWGSHLIKGLDPELLDADGTSTGYLYPLTRVINFGANVQF